jgi:hypothetical protein
MVRCYQAMVAATEPDPYGREDAGRAQSSPRMPRRPQRSPTLTAGKTEAWGPADPDGQEAATEPDPYGREEPRRRHPPDQPGQAATEPDPYGREDGSSRSYTWTSDDVADRERCARGSMLAVVSARDDCRSWRHTGRERSPALVTSPERSHHTMRAPEVGTGPVDPGGQPPNRNCSTTRLYESRCWPPDTSSTSIARVPSWRSRYSRILSPGISP